MKKLIVTFVFALVSITFSQAQEATLIQLKQTPGAFETESLTLSADTPYVFEVTNNGVDRAVGFVIAPKGMTDQKNHVENAYLSKTIKNGESASSKTVQLEKGEYVYFCPLNPTPQYTITVQ